MGFPVRTLHEQLVAVLPIVGVNIGDVNDRTTWTANFGATVIATPAQAQQVAAIIAAFDVKAAQAKEATPPATLEGVVAVLLAKGVLTSADVAQLTAPVTAPMVTLLF